MINANDNAFPLYREGKADETEFGLTKREYFAALFMAGTLANPEGMAYLSKFHDADLSTAFDRISSKSVKLADALISQLNKVPEPIET